MPRRQRGPEFSRPFSVQFMLRRGGGVNWLTNLRHNLLPHAGPAHISVVPRLWISEDDYDQLLEDIDNLAQEYAPFSFEAVGLDYGNLNGCVAVEVEDEEERLEEIIDEVHFLTSMDRNRFSAHVTIYKGSSRTTFFPYFDDSMDFEDLRDAVADELDDYERAKGGPLSGRVIGLQLVQDDVIQASFSFGA
ncbi:hypothetical protein B0H16DRAFT_496023 [Mycena metata]|uniref:2'-5' RNA ligase family protein n=1 Tax=Mycena metata TaxID=1033252 RepID=A0AAD7HAA5_9AGAR|nr:hypothetical protein B0H16DRAFT_496023 [Mycena metata]